MESKEKKRLLVFHKGVAPYRVDFFNNLAKHYDMLLYMDRKPSYQSLYGDINNDYLFNFIEYNSKGSKIRTIKMVIKAIISYSPDTIMVAECGIVSILVVLLKFFLSKNYRVVCLIDDSYQMLVDHNHFTKRHELSEKLMIPMFDDIVNVEPKVADFFREKYGKGVYFPIIRDDTKYRKNLYKSLDISKRTVEEYDLARKKVILYVGRFVAIKNIIRLIEIVQSLADESVKLILVGTGPEEIEYRKITDLSKVIFVGPQTGNNLYAWYNIADIFALPSIQEAFGAVTNEALMAGCKCIISKRAGSSCLIKEGINGYCIDPLNNDDIKEKIIILLKQVDVESKKNEVKQNLMQTTFEKEIKKVLAII